MNERKGKFIQTFTGIYFYPLDPRLEDIVIEDIAHALSNQCRFSGHSKHFYSVAQHCVYVSTQCGIHSLTGLLHDASEAYLVDVPRPIKSEFPNYLNIEKNIMSLIAKKFGIQFPFPDSVTLVDNQMLWVEKKNVMSVDCNWSQDIKPELTPNQQGMIIPVWSPEVSKSMFLDRFYSLYK